MNCKFRLQLAGMATKPGSLAGEQPSSRGPFLFQKYVWLEILKKCLLDSEINVSL